MGLLAVLVSERLVAERIIAPGRHRERQKVAFEFSATDTIEERGRTGRPARAPDVARPLCHRLDASERRLAWQ